MIVEVISRTTQELNLEIQEKQSLDKQPLRIYWKLWKRKKKNTNTENESFKPFQWKVAGLKWKGTHGFLAPKKY